MTELKEYRKIIDTIDAEITELLENRLDVVKKVAVYKERKGLPVLDASREQEKIEALESFCEEGKTAYVSEVLKEIMAQSRRYQEDHKLAYGLLGGTLGHSYSPRIHRIIGGYEYGLYEREPDQLDAFFREGSFRGISVTMPYKKDVIRYCGELSETARRCGSVNTIVRRSDGTYFGDNTDYDGFRSTVLSSGADVKGAKAVILGSGGVSATVRKVMEDLGADPVVVISRSGSDNYETIGRHFDAGVVVNATPVGMFPKAGEAAVDIRQFTECRAVFDLIYNPLRTKLMLDAEDAGIPAFGGLHMLAAQAAKACGLFLDEEIDLNAKATTACAEIRSEIENIVLIGMPGSGKTTIGKKLAELMGRTFIDCDERIEDTTGRSPEAIIRGDGVERFREIEAEVIQKVMRRGPDPDGEVRGIVFATGGGCVERDENKTPLRENSMVVFLRRDLSELPEEGRPVSQTDGVQAVFDRRRDRYEAWSDVQVHSGEGAAEEILRAFAERSRSL